MSISVFVKLNLFILMLLLFPAVVEGKTLVFGEQRWETEINLNQFYSQPYVRNDFALLEMSKANFFSQPLTDSVRFLDQASLDQIQALSLEINQPTENAKLVVENDVATEFSPGQNGQQLDIYLLAKFLSTDLVYVELPVVVSEPEVKLAQTNQLGIVELVGIGESDFSGSPNNRIHNIRIGAEKFNGLIIKPGEEFSFNKFLGDVDGEHGFLPELVIKSTGLVPEFGGGLCQVSSTAFRAAMNSGLPIAERRNHSFAVQYYAPQGTDATIYPGVTDFRFVNNLRSNMLIRTRIDGYKLFFEYYGTKDDRRIAFEGPTQYDRKSNGSMKATWIRHVTINNQTTTQTFNSTYQPPALFKREVAPTTPNPDATTPPPLTEPNEDNNQQT